MTTKIEVPPPKHYRAHCGGCGAVYSYELGDVTYGGFVYCPACGGMRYHTPPRQQEKLRRRGGQ